MFGALAPGAGLLIAVVLFVIIPLRPERVAVVIGHRIALDAKCGPVGSARLDEQGIELRHSIERRLASFLESRLVLWCDPGHCGTLRKRRLFCSISPVASHRSRMRSHS